MCFMMAIFSNILSYKIQSLYKQFLSWVVFFLISKQQFSLWQQFPPPWFILCGHVTTSGEAFFKDPSLISFVAFLLHCCIIPLKWIIVSPVIVDDVLLVYICKCFLPENRSESRSLSVFLLSLGPSSRRHGPLSVDSVMGVRQAWWSWGSWWSRRPHWPWFSLWPWFPSDSR